MVTLNIVKLISVVVVLVGLLSETVVGQQNNPPYGPEVAQRVTPAFFYGIRDKAPDNGCPGKTFYNRHSFLEAIKSYPRFGRRALPEREIAAFFAHVTHETGFLCHIAELKERRQDYCDRSNTQYPCTPGKEYYGRGPLQITWNYNYGPAGQANSFDGLNSPETVAKDPIIAFKTALWFWMENVHKIVVTGQGFGATIRKINGDQECYGRNPDAVQARVTYYKQYCGQLGVEPEENQQLYC